MGSGCGWERIERFDTFERYNSVKAAVSEQVSAGLAKETRVLKPYSGLKTLDERWFRCSADGRIWRLIAPDPPFPGIFEPIDQ
jgi:hypothetical protein